MSTIDVKDAVREKYAQAALKAGATGASCCGAASARDRRQSHHLETLRYRRGRFRP